MNCGKKSNCTRCAFSSWGRERGTEGEEEDPRASQGGVLCCHSGGSSCQQSAAWSCEGHFCHCTAGAEVKGWCGIQGHEWLARGTIPQGDGKVTTVLLLIYGNNYINDDRRQQCYCTHSRMLVTCIWAIFCNGLDIFYFKRQDYWFVSLTQTCSYIYCKKAKQLQLNFHLIC